MISRIHSKLGTAGLVVAIVALVAALGGGAYAAQQGLNGKQKKEVKKIAKKFAGAPGATGPQGQKGDTGATGPAGKDGTNGTNGTNGTDGEPGADGEPGMCSGEEPECSLAPGGLLTGVWSATGSEHISPAAISFPVRVSPAPTAIYASDVAEFDVGYQLKDGSVVLYGPYPCVEGCEGSIFEQEDVFGALQESEDAFLAACSGSASEPKAASGFLCIYRKDFDGGATSPAPGDSVSAKSEAAHTFGVTVPFEFNAGGGYIRGSWAVAG